MFLKLEVLFQLTYYSCFKYPFSQVRNFSLFMVYNSFITKFLPSFLPSSHSLFLSLGHVACRILVPCPGVEPVPTAVEAWSPNHQTAREFPKFTIFKCSVHSYEVRSHCCVQPLPPSISRTFSSSPNETLYQLNSNYPFLPPPRP